MSEDEVDAVDYESIYEGEDDIGLVIDSVSDDEEDSNRERPLPRMPEFRPDKENRDLQLRLGLVFPDAKMFRDSVREHAIKEGKDIWFKKNDLNRVRAICSATNCNWVCLVAPIYGSKTWAIKTFNGAHNCERTDVFPFSKF